MKIINRSHKLALALISSYIPPRQSPSADDNIYEQITDMSCYSDRVLFGDFNISVTKSAEPLNSYFGRDLYNDYMKAPAPTC